jgi:hypothetical protein
MKPNIYDVSSLLLHVRYTIKPPTLAFSNEPNKKPFLVVLLKPNPYPMPTPRDIEITAATYFRTGTD